MPEYAHIEETVIGVFGLTPEGTIIEKALYPREPEKIAKALRRQRNGELTKEVSKVAEGLVKRGFRKFTISNPDLEEVLKDEFNVDIEVVERGPTEDLKLSLPKIAKQFRIVETENAFYDLSQEVSVLLARGAVTDALSGREAIITQTVQLLGELDTTLNGVNSRLREWYGIHYPELTRVVKDHRAYARFIVEIGARSNVTKERVEAWGLQGREVASILKGVDDSMGAQLGESDLDEIKLFAGKVLILFDYREHLSEFISSIAAEVAPNLSSVAGPILAAKLIEKAGSIKKLAMMPASSLQVLGAEKALYRAVKTKARPPKHGLIFQHPYVSGAPRGLRGVRSRRLSAKLSIAARADAFSGNFIADELKKELDNVS